MRDTDHGQARSLGGAARQATHGERGAAARSLPKMAPGPTQTPVEVRATAWANGLTKRCLDVVGSSILLLLSAPAWPLVALFVKLASPGPVFVRQLRAGRGEEPFRLLKFRSMREQAEPAPEAPDLTRKQRSASRTTAFGRLLRRTSLDELPQLINVFCGHMSLVGPRPLVFPDLDDPYDIAPSEGEVDPEAVHRWRQVRCQVRPGLTGLWQVKGRSSLPFEGWLRYDAEYVQRCSPGLDVAVLLKTVPAVLRGIGAF